MPAEMKLTGFYSGALFSGLELHNNRIFAKEIERASGGVVKILLPQDLSAQDTGDGSKTRSADYLGMLRCDFVFANMNGTELDSGTVAEYMVASMLGMPRVQYRSDFRQVGDVESKFPKAITVGKTKDVPYNLMLGYDESAFVFVNSMLLYKTAKDLEQFTRKLGAAAVKGIKLAYQTEIAKPREYDSQRNALERFLKLDARSITSILKAKRKRHLSAEYRQAVGKLATL
jgi:nucleoside 2-deoxyribosyltransferase